MKKEKLNLSGMSTYSTIAFFGKRFSSSITMKDGKFNVDESEFSLNTSIFKFFSKIPFIRGPLHLLFMLINILVYYIKKNALAGVLIIGFLFYIIFSPKTEVVVSRGIFWDNFIPILIQIGIIGYIYYARVNHSIEHKLIGAVEDGRDLSLDNIKKQSKENRRCGGVLASWMLLSVIIIYLLFGEGPTLFQFIVVLSISYECFKLAGLKNIIGDIFYAPGYLIQKLTTSNNTSDDELLKARKAIMALLDKEKEAYIT